MKTKTHESLVFTASRATRFWQWLGYYGKYDDAIFNWRQDVPKGGDLLTTETKVHLDWADRFRLLFSGKCEVVVYTKTQMTIGKTETRSQFRVLP